MPEDLPDQEDRMVGPLSLRTASILAVLSGILVAANGLTWLLIGQAYAVTIDDSPYAVWTISLAGFAFGLMILVGGIMLGRARDHESMLSWAAAIAMLSAVSLTLAAGGFIVGFILAMIAIWTVVKIQKPTKTKTKLASKH